MLFQSSVYIYMYINNAEAEGQYNGTEVVTANMCVSKRTYTMTQ